MKPINQHNYEAFLIDYLDNNLSAEQKLQVESFLNQHPDIAVEFELLRKNSVQLHDKSQFAGKTLLLKDENSLSGSLAADYMIAITENDSASILPTTSDMSIELQRYRQCKLEADTHIIYTDKNNLLKQTPVFQLFSPFQTILSVAAALLLFWGLVQFYNQNAQSPTALKHAAFESKIIHYKRLETPVIELLEQNKPERKSTENQPVFADNRITHKEIENANQIIEAQRKTEKIEILPMYEQQQLQTGIIAQAAPSLPDAKVDLIKKLHRINWSEENLEIARQMAKQKLNESIAPIVQEEKSIFWSVAEFSVDKISAATGRPMKFENTYDEEGKIKVLAFSSKNFGLTKNIY